MEKRSSPVPDAWASGDAYEPYVGRWSQAVAREFLLWLQVPSGRVWLDVGSGTGALTRAILELSEPAAVTGVDSSEGYVAYATAQLQHPRVQFEVGDAQALPVRDRQYDAVVSGLVLNFLPEPGRAVTEMARAARPGGVVAAYVWDYAGEMQFMRRFWDAAVALDPEATALDEGRRFPLCRPEPLQKLFQEAELDKVEVRPIEIPTHFRDFDDYWSPFLGGQGPAPGYAVSLSEERREALRDRVRASLPFDSDGSIPLVARAWAVRGIRQ